MIMYIYEADYALVFLFRIKVKVDFVFAPVGAV